MRLSIYTSSKEVLVDIPILYHFWSMTVGRFTLAVTWGRQHVACSKVLMPADVWRLCCNLQAITCRSTHITWWYYHISHINEIIIYIYILWINPSYCIMSFDLYMLLISHKRCAFWSYFPSCPGPCGGELVLFFNQIIRCHYDSIK
jgi:hypothetical protein